MNEISLPDIPSSPAPPSAPHNSGERLPSSDAAEGAGETRFVLDEAAFMAALAEPESLDLPSPQYVAAIERGFV